MDLGTNNCKFEFILNNNICCFFFFSYVILLLNLNYFVQASLVLNKGFQIFSYHLEVINAMFLPIQGFLNALVYSRNDVSKFMGDAKRRMSLSLFSLCTTTSRNREEEMIDDFSISQEEISLENVDENDSFEENH